MWVKICGITNLEDALCAAEARADAIGFVFYQNSPRYISPEKAHQIAQKLPFGICKIGLFVNASAEEINTIANTSGIDRAQIHFEVDEDFLKALKVPYMRVIRAQMPEDIIQNQGTVRLVDAYVKSFGGAGKRLDLSWFDKADRNNIILAGGLTPSSLDEVKSLGFYGVDVSSGVEKSQGIKDHDLVRAFVQKAKV